MFLPTMISNQATMFDGRDKTQLRRNHWIVCRKLHLAQVLGGKQQFTHQYCHIYICTHIHTDPYVVQYVWGYVPMYAGTISRHDIWRALFHGSYSNWSIYRNNSKIKMLSILYYIIISKSNPIWRKTVWCKDWCGSTPSHIDLPDPTSIGCAIGSRHCGLPKANITLVQFRRQMELEHMQLQLESSKALSGSKMTFPFSIPPRVPNFSCYDALWWRTLKE